MNPGTFYLYEYENNRRRRNVGFIKISRHYRSCVLQIHARGIPAGNGACMELYAFYCDNKDLVGTQIAELNCFSRSISVRLPIPEARFPESCTLSRIDGFLIRLPGNSTPLFWMASTVFFDVDISRLRSPEESSSKEAVTAAEKPPAQSPKAKQDIQDTAIEETENSQEMMENESDKALADESITDSYARKIRREDISLLPRRFWPLANNSFLLHGYHNYSHLILIEENGRLWLGVPGIYDQHEARAADLFGFPRFIRSYTDCIGLEEEERCDNPDFGHWCRCVGPSSK